MQNFLNMIIAVVAGSAFGWFSAIGMIETTGLTSVEGNPNWKERRTGQEQSFAPYTAGYYLSQGQVPPPATVRLYVRSTDDDGSALRAECTYMLENKPHASRWWSIAIRGKNGTVETYSANEAVLTSSGALNLAIANSPMPGNRLTSPESGAFTVSYLIQEASAEPGSPAPPLPSIRRIAC